MSLYQRLYRRERLEQDVDEEVRAYYEILATREMRRGLSQSEALRAVRVRFEGQEQVKEMVREARMGITIENLTRDLRYAVRSLTHAKGFAATVMLTVAICIAANTGTFAIVNSVLLRPLPFPESDRTVLMANSYPKAGIGVMYTSGSGDYYDRLQSVTALDDQAMFRNSDVLINVRGSATRMQATFVTPSFFSLIRTRPALGRAFTAEEGEIGGERKVILSDGLWQEMFGGDHGVIGRDLRIAGQPYTIVGVMPRGFLFLNPDTRLWIPLAFTAEQKTAHHSNNWYNIGRLKPGATIAQVQSQVNMVNAANLKQFPEFREALESAGFHTRAIPLQDMLTKDAESTLYLLWAGAIVVLFIGTLNLVNISLARMASRQREIATRLAIGAGRVQVLRQLTFENVLLALCGGVLGVLLGAGLLRALPVLGLDRLPRASEVRIDALVLVCSVGMALAVGVLIGLWPLSAFLRNSVSGMLHEKSRGGTAGKGTRRLRQALVGAQIGMAFVLLLGAGLLVTTVQHLLELDPGYATSGVVTGSTVATQAKYPQEREVLNLVNNTLAGLRAIPGVTAAGATTSIPLGGDYSDSVLIGEGHVLKPGESVVSPYQMAVTPGYFKAMGMSMVSGREFQESDTEGSQPIVIIDERIARRFWPGQDAVGRRVYLPTSPSDLVKENPNRRWLTVVGVARSVRLADLAGGGNQAGSYYFPYKQNWSRGITFALRTSGDAAAVERAMRAELSRNDPELALFDVRTMQERAELSISSRRVAMMLATCFGTVALLLSAIGIYGVLAYLVAQRRREIGIRMALGSTATEVVRLVVREGVVLVVAGIAVGLVAAVAVRSLLTSQIYGVRVLDPVVMGTVAVSLAAIGLVACVEPARRAVRLNPVSVLSEE